ncbi:MAG: ParB/RepB/Spo0J family partition protein [Patescibacteria group bacterium]
MSYIQDDSIYWIEVEKIKPNPFQPRREFDGIKLQSLSDSIRQYGVLQPLVVTRQEEIKEDKGLIVSYELIAGERRLRASKLAGLQQVPVIIRTDEEDDGLKLELAIIENLQREDLNPIDRARAFERLISEFNLKHTEVGKKVGKSREYVSNTVRLLTLPEEMIQAVANRQILEGHTRPILMLKDRPEEQLTLFKEIIYKKLSVRDAESIARRIAYDKVRKKDLAIDPELVEYEEKLAESLGTRVQIERKEVGGKVIIDFFTNADIKKIIDTLHSDVVRDPNETLNNYEKNNKQQLEKEKMDFAGQQDGIASEKMEDDTDDELYSLKDFSI